MQNSDKKIIDPIPFSDEDILEGMQALPGYIDITVNDFKELYRTIYALARDRLQQRVTAGAIMHSPAHCLEAGTALMDAVSYLSKHNISGVPVVDEAKRIVGMLSEKDILHCLGIKNLTKSIQLMANTAAALPAIPASRKNMPIQEIMVQPALTVFEQSPLHDILELFRTHDINRIPVVDEAGRVVGIITRSDMLRTFSILMP
jgi:CBS domain-containing membrane protein